MESITNVVSSVVMAILAVVSSVIAFFKGNKAKKNGKSVVDTEAQLKEESAKNAITAEIKKLIVGAEEAYKSIDKFMKSQNSSAGGLKKGYVLNSLKAFCLEHGYVWDDEKMNEAIEAEIAFSKSVNVH